MWGAVSAVSEPRSPGGSGNLALAESLSLLRHSFVHRMCHPRLGVTASASWIDLNKVCECRSSRGCCSRTSFLLSLDANTVELTMRCLTVLVIAAASMQFELLYARPAVPEWLRIAPRNDREEVPSQGSDEDRLAMYAVNNAIIVDISTRAVGDFPDPTYVRHDRVDETVVGQLGGEAHLT